MASSRGATVAQIAIAWVLGRGTDIVPLVGARRRDRLHESLGALQLQLSDDDVARIEAAIPKEGLVGGRYAPPVLAMLDSER